MWNDAVLELRLPDKKQYRNRVQLLLLLFSNKTDLGSMLFVAPRIKNDSKINFLGSGV